MSQFSFGAVVSNPVLQPTQQRCYRHYTRYIIWTLLLFARLSFCGFTAHIGRTLPHYRGSYITRTRWDSSERVTNWSQRPLSLQHTTNTTDEHPCPQRNSNPPSQKIERPQSNALDCTANAIRVLSILHVSTACRIVQHVCWQPFNLLCRDLREHKMHFAITTTLNYNTIRAAQSEHFYRPVCTVVEVLCYKSEGRWFDSRWCHWNFSLT
jgi:hypothetical protein